MFKSDKQKEIHINTYYLENFTEEEVVKDLIYLTNPKRLHKTSEAFIRRAYKVGTIGKMVRRLDPVRFNTWTEHN